MTRVRQKLAFSLILAGLAIPLAVVSVAYACGHLVTLYLPGHARPGATVSGWGSGYNVAPGSSPVTLRFNSRSGSVLWSGAPNVGGAIYPSFQAPHVRPGYYIILTEQSTPTGAAQVGTPGRAAIYIGAHRPNHAKLSAAWAPPTSGGSGPRASAATPGVRGGPSTVLLATLFSAALVGGGVMLLLSDRRRRHPSLAS